MGALMPLGQIRVDPAEYPEQEMPCLRCGTSVRLRFAGPCPACTDALRSSMRGQVQAVDAAYVPKMNVTPNAVALKE
jgi:hypothetical protein